MSNAVVLRAKAPLRLSFAGGGTDVPAYYRREPGAALVSSINRYSFATLHPRTDRDINIVSLDFDLAVKHSIDEAPIYNGALDLAKAVIHRMGAAQGFDLLIHGDAPPGTGLGGSSSMAVAMIGTLLQNGHQDLTRYEVAEMAYEVERIELKISGGKQDQYAIAFGGFNLIEFFSDRVVVTPLRIDRCILNDLEYHLMLCYTGKTRLSVGLIDRQVQYYLEGRPETLEGMRGLYDLTFQMKECLLKGRLLEFGELLGVAMDHKKMMNPHVTDPEIDEMYAVARREGVIGGKILGAGGGGYLLLFCEAASKHRVREKLEQMGGRFTPFAFDDHGLQTWRSAARSPIEVPVSRPAALASSRLEAGV